MVQGEAWSFFFLDASGVVAETVHLDDLVVEMGAYVDVSHQQGQGGDDELDDEDQDGVDPFERRTGPELDALVVEVESGYADGNCSLENADGSRQQEGCDPYERRVDQHLPLSLFRVLGVEADDRVVSVDCNRQDCTCK